MNNVQFIMVFQIFSIIHHYSTSPALVPYAPAAGGSPRGGEFVGG